MTTKNAVRIRIEDDGSMLRGLNRVSFSDRIMTAKDRAALVANGVAGLSGEISRRPFILHWTNQNEREKRARRSKVIDLTMYVYAVAVMLYSVASNSVSIFLLGILGFAMYVVISHVYEQRPRSRQEIADKNYADLISPTVEKN